MTRIASHMFAGIGIASRLPAEALFPVAVQCEKRSEAPATLPVWTFSRFRPPYFELSSKGFFPMRTPMQARSTAIRYTLFACAALLGACKGEMTAPSAAAPAKSVEAVSKFVPTAAQKALIGVVDGTYSVTVDPRVNQSLSLGPNHLDIPANSICNLLTSGYGTSTWNNACTPQTLPVTITVVIKNSQTDKPQIDFYPAMRFNPSKNVELFMYVPRVNASDANNWVMKYCNDLGMCIDESTVDKDLVTRVDRDASVLFRRIKHFSGYLGTGRDGCLDPDPLMCPVP